MKKNFLIKKIKSLSIIAPNKLLINRVVDAINLIKKIDSKEYEHIFSRLKIIFITNKNGYTNEFFMPERIWLANKSVINNNDLKWLASLIIHEAFHATQFKNGKYILPFGEKLEKPALKLQEKFLKKCDDIFFKKDINKVYKEKYWAEMSEDIKSYSYFRNLLYFLEQNKLKIRKIKSWL